MDKAKSKDKLVGRPKIPQYKINAALEMTEKGINYKTIVKKAGDFQIDIFLN